MRMIFSKKYWWIFLVLAGVVAWILYQTFSGNPTIAKTLTIGTSTKQIAPQAPASAVTQFCCGFTCSLPI